MLLHIRPIRNLIPFRHAPGRRRARVCFTLQIYAPFLVVEKIFHVVFGESNKIVVPLTMPCFCIHNILHRYILPAALVPYDCYRSCVVGLYPFIVPAKFSDVSSSVGINSCNQFNCVIFVMMIKTPSPSTTQKVV